VFGCKGKEALVEQLPVVSTVDVTSRAGATSKSVAEKDGVSAALLVGGRQDDLYMTDSQLTLGQHVVEAGVTNVEDDNNRCLYIGTPWENDVITNRCDVDTFKEVSHVIAQTLAVRTCTLRPRSLSFIPSVL
jgi:hypothetical protein